MTNRVDYASTQWLDEFAHRTLDSVRSNFERAGQLLPVIMVLGRRDLKTGLVLPAPEMTVVGFDANSPKVKGRLSVLIKQFALSVDAVAVVVATEAWMVQAQEGERIDDLTAMAPSAHPRREEVVHVTIDALAGCRLFWATILGGAGQRRLGLFESKTPSSTEGRLTNLLASRANQN